MSTREERLAAQRVADVQNARHGVWAASVERRQLAAKLAGREAAADAERAASQERAEAAQAADRAADREIANAALRAKGHAVTAQDGRDAARRRIASRRPGGPR